MEHPFTVLKEADPRIGGGCPLSVLCSLYSEYTQLPLQRGCSLAAPSFIPVHPFTCLLSSCLINVVSLLHLKTFLSTATFLKSSPSFGLLSEHIRPKQKPSPLLQASHFDLGLFIAYLSSQCLGLGS